MLRCHRRIRLSHGVSGSVAARLSRPDSLVRASRPGFRELVLRVVATRRRLAAGAFRCTQTDPRRPLDTGCFCVVEPADERRVRFVGASRIAFLAGLEPTTRSSLVEGDLPVTFGHRSRLGSGPPLQAIARVGAPDSGDILNQGLSTSR